MEAGALVTAAWVPVPPGPLKLMPPPPAAANVLELVRVTGDGLAGFTVPVST